LSVVVLFRGYNGGDESKTPVFMTMAGLDERKYIKENGYTTEFWNITLRVN
jgi:hypothetical protein